MSPHARGATPQPRPLSASLPPGGVRFCPPGSYCLQSHPSDARLALSAWGLSCSPPPQTLASSHRPVGCSSPHILWTSPPTFQSSLGMLRLQSVAPPGPTSGQKTGAESPKPKGPGLKGKEEESRLYSSPWGRDVLAPWTISRKGPETYPGVALS